MPFLFQLQFTTISFFWLLGCILLGIGYSIILYKPSESNSTLTRSLFILRTIAIASIAFLLVAPMIKFTGKNTEKPLIIIAKDNSASIIISKAPGFNSTDFTKQLGQIEKDLSSEYDVKSFTFGANIKSNNPSTYNESLSNINSVFKYINEQYPNRNIGAVILSTDGIYNEGGNPEFEAKNIKSPIYSIALGDTIPKKDLLISNVNFNNIVYLNNDFQIEISVEAFQSKGSSSRLTVSTSGGVASSKSVSINSNEYRISVPVTLSASKKGVQKFTVNLSAIGGELSLKNNTQSFFVEVIDGKNKVLIISNSPHPDISALKQSIEGNKNYEVKSVLASDYKPLDIAQAGLVILHQLPSTSDNARNIISLITQKPVWYILGAQSNVPAFVASQNLLGINSTGATEEVTAKVSSGFYDFVLSEQTKNSIQNFSPLLAPFGSYTIKGQSSVLLNQQIGKLVTDRPLLLFSKDGERKIAILAAEGLWRWRLENFQETGTHAAVDELLSKVVQFMVSKDDKRRFRVYPSKSTFNENERIILNAELYNDAYELVNTPDAQVTIKNNKNKSYPFLFTRSGNGYILDAGILPSGEYSFTSTTKLGEKKYSAQGQFFVVQQQAEFRQTTANHQLLYNLSNLNNGEVVYPSNLDKLIDKIRANELIKTVSYEDKRFEELINLKLIFFLILALLSVEWFLRKRNGKA